MITFQSHTIAVAKSQVIPHASSLKVLFGYSFCIVSCKGFKVRIEAYFKLSLRKTLPSGFRIRSSLEEGAGVLHKRLYGKTSVRKGCRLHPPGLHNGQKILNLSFCVQKG